MDSLFRWLGRRLVRRVLYTLVLAGLAFLAQMALPEKAHAASDCPTASGGQSGRVCDQGIALTMCKAAVARTIAKFNSSPSPWGTPTVLADCTGGTPDAQGQGTYTCAVKEGPNGGVVRCYNAAGDVDGQYFYFAGSCAARNGNKLADAALAYSPSPTCISGCKVQGEPFTSSTGGVKLYGMRNRTYTGDTCAAQNINANDINQPDEKQKTEDETKPKGPECTALGNGQTGCQKPDGDYCATSSTGKTFCWKPSEKGKKTDAQDGQTRDEKGKPVTPPDTPPAPDKDWQRKEGHQQEACINNTCVTYNVTNFGGTSKGGAKNGSGDNNPDGSGNTSGNGTPGKGTGGTGGGGKDEDGDSASESGNCQQPPTCVGDTLKCLHLKFTWKIECNTKGNKITGGDGCSDGDVPVCAGDSCKAEQYAQVLQQWKQRCAVQAMGEGMASRAGNISNPDDAGVVDGIWIKEGNGNGPKLRQDLVNVGGGGSLLPDVTLEGQKWEVPSQFWDIIAGIRVLIIAMATIMAMYIVGRNI